MTTKKIINFHIKNSRFSDKVKEGKQDNPSIVRKHDILFDDHYYTPPIQLDIIGSLFVNTFKGDPFPIQFQTICEQINRHINTKVSSYQMQDKIKKRKITDKFITKNDIIQKLFNSKLKCHYCCESVNILYLAAREITQWTLDRLDNTFGHTKDNVVICCLSCNIGRKTMYKERYLFTKQLNITKKL